MSLVGTAERTIITFSYSFFNTASKAKYKDIKVLPVPAEPSKHKWLPLAKASNASFWFCVKGSNLARCSSFKRVGFLFILYLCYP